MANELTGDFEAVLQVSERTLNRLMASLHQNADGTNMPRHPHVIAMPITGNESVDGLSGTVRAQLGVPTIVLLDRATDRFELAVNVRAEFLEDEDVSAAYLPRFIDGVIRATYRIHVIDPNCVGWRTAAAQHLWLRVIEDTVRFTGSVSGVDDPEVVGRIERLLAHLLDNRFEAAPHPLKASFNPALMRSLKSAADDVAVFPLSVSGGAPEGDITSVEKVLKTFAENASSKDSDFAVAVSADWAKAKIEEALDVIRNKQLALQIVVNVNIVGGFHETRVYPATARVTHLTAEWEGDNTFTGSIHIRGGGEVVDGANNLLARFEVEDQLVMSLMGNSVQVRYDFHPVVDVKDLPWWAAPFADDFREDAKTKIIEVLNDNLKTRYISLSSYLSQLVSQLRTLDDQADANLSNAYFNAAGVVLFGRITLSARKPPVNHFEKSGDGLGFTALKSWAPGGWIERFEWSWWIDGQHKSSSNRHRYVLTRPQTGYTPWGMPLRTPDGQALPGLDRSGTMCLTIHGFQLNNVTGVKMPFHLRSCVHYGQPVSVAGKLLQTIRAGRDVGVAQLGNAAVDASAANTLIVYSGGGFNPEAITAVGAALDGSARDDAGLIVVALVAEGSNSHERGEFSERIGALVDVVEDVDQTWTGRLAIPPDAPAWRLITPTGAFAWSHDGQIATEELTRALDEHLRPSPYPAYRRTTGMLSPATKAPPMVIQRSSGREHHCPRSHPRSDVGMVFIVEGSHASERQLDNAFERWAQMDAHGPNLLVVVDGSRQYAEDLSRRYGRFEIIADADGTVASQFGIRVWPTFIGIDGDRNVKVIREGLFEFEEPPPMPSEVTTAPEGNRS
jgi:hypothetical protein